MPTDQQLKNNMKLTQKEKIYTTYITTLLKGGDIKLVHEKMKCSRKHVYNVVKKFESDDIFSLSENIRKQLWEKRYKLVFDLAKKKEDTKTIHALIRKLYFSHGFGRKEIAQNMGYSHSNIDLAIWG